MKIPGRREAKKPPRILPSLTLGSVATIDYLAKLSIANERVPRGLREHVLKHEAISAHHRGNRERNELRARSKKERELTAVGIVITKW